MYPMQQQFWNKQYPPQYDIIEVNGENGANAFQMGPNSKVLLLDNTAPIVWFAKTDGAGYKTIIPYDITPHLQQPSVDINQLEQRVISLEEKLNAKSNSGTSKNAKHANSEQ